MRRTFRDNGHPPTHSLAGQENTRVFSRYTSEQRSTGNKWHSQQFNVNCCTGSLLMGIKDRNSLGTFEYIRRAPAWIALTLFFGTIFLRVMAHTGRHEGFDLVGMFFLGWAFALIGVA